jgi:hypothetical protein
LIASLKLNNCNHCATPAQEGFGVLSRRKNFIYFYIAQIQLSWRTLFFA